MEEFLKYADFAGLVGIWIVVFWLAKLIVNLKSGIEAQGMIIASMSSQADYVNNVQSTVSRLYDPAEIEKLVDAKTQQVLGSHKANTDKLVERGDQSIQSLYGFVGNSVTYLNEGQLRDVFQRMKPELRSSELEEFAFKLRAEIEEIRSEAIGENLGGNVPKT